MDNIALLDCTLRDGGYVNGWHFGEKTIRQTYQKLCQSSIDIIECGYLSETRCTGDDSSIYGSISDVNSRFEKRKSGSVAVMINCGEYVLEHLEPCCDGAVDTIRIAFHKHQLEDAKALCCAAKEKGYTVFLQPMYTLGYSEQELASLIEFANDYSPAAVYIVDSFGTMRKDDLLRIFRFFDSGLKDGIKIGSHSHNNLQLAFSNTQEFLSLRTSRPLLIDSSVFGMGRGAGNLCSELMVQYFNENIEQRYDLIPILEIIDEFIHPIYARSPWGYSVPYYLAAINDVHPNYATYLMNRGSLCVKDMNIILSELSDAAKQLYNEDLIEELYARYQAHIVDDSECMEQLHERCSGRDVLLIAPGMSGLLYRDKIAGYIEHFAPVVFGVNHIPPFFSCDYIFMSNLKRIQKLDDAITELGKRLICTSNITCDRRVLVTDYSSNLIDDSTVSDNSGLVLIEILKHAGARSFVLAGFDGLTQMNDQNYYDIKLNTSIDLQEKGRINDGMVKWLSKTRNTHPLTFITPSVYERRMNNTGSEGEGK